MKVLHVAVFTSRSTNVWQADGFEVLGHRVIRYDYRADLKRFNCMSKRDDYLITLCRKERPDLILFSKCNLMDVRVVKECNKVGATVLWYMDDQGPNWDLELIDKMRHVNYVFCSVKKCAEDAKIFCKNSYRLQGGFDPVVHCPMFLPKIRDAVFIGTLRPEKEIFRKCAFSIKTGVYNEAHSRFVSETKINLNFTHGGGTSNRLYKLMAAGGFVLTEPWDGLMEDFTPGKDFVVFTSPNDLNEKIQYYLAHEEERNEIADQGRRTVMKYDNVNYARVISEKVWSKHL